MPALVTRKSIRPKADSVFSTAALDLGLRGDVHFFDQWLGGAGCFNFTRQCLQQRLVDVDQRQARTETCQVQRRRPPDPARGPGHNAELSAEIP